MAAGDLRRSRRDVLLGAVGLGLAAAGCASEQADDPARTVRSSSASGTLSAASASALPRPVTIERVRSMARRTEIELIVIRPEGAEPDLPVCLALHGRGENARMFLDLGLPDMLSSLVNSQGGSPFAVVAVDGGDSYWVARQPEDDPQLMLTDDMPKWLGERGLATNPFAVLGISMGGYGALNYAANPNKPVAAAISPALFLSWSEAANRDAFANEQRWRDTDPLQNVPAYTGVPVGLWCGESDPFVDGARDLAEKLRPPIAEIEPGGHDATYWRKVLPRALRFVGQHL
ncbi:alpha/beta hydrolase, partial [Actinophytocola xanthii]